MRVHKSITAARVCNAVERSYSTLDNPGFCIACGRKQGGCEPDARGYTCESCGEPKVYGAEELMMTMAL